MTWWSIGNWCRRITKFRKEEQKDSRLLSQKARVRASLKGHFNEKLFWHRQNRSRAWSRPRHNRSRAWKPSCAVWAAGPAACTAHLVVQGDCLYRGGAAKLVRLVWPSTNTSTRIPAQCPRKAEPGAGQHISNVSVSCACHVLDVGSVASHPFWPRPLAPFRLNVLLEGGMTQRAVARHTDGSPKGRPLDWCRYGPGLPDQVYFKRRAWCLLLVLPVTLMHGPQPPHRLVCFVSCSACHWVLHRRCHRIKLPSHPPAQVPRGL